MVPIQKILAKISILEKKIVHFWNLFVTQNPDIERLNYNKTFLPDNAIILLESKI